MPIVFCVHNGKPDTMRWKHYEVRAVGYDGELIPPGNPARLPVEGYAAVVPCALGDHMLTIMPSADLSVGRVVESNRSRRPFFLFATVQEACMVIEDYNREAAARAKASTDTPPEA